MNTQTTDTQTPDTQTMARDYHCRITANVTAKEVFDNICNVSGWWAPNFQGSARQNNDRFTVRFGDTFVDFAITESIPYQRIVWQVLDCSLPWLKDKKEWNNTSVVWEIAEENGSTTIDLTHVGLLPEVECFTNCESGWNHYIKESLFQLITQHKGFPERKK